MSPSFWERQQEGTGRAAQRHLRQGNHGVKCICWDGLGPVGRSPHLPLLPNLGFSPHGEVTASTLEAAHRVAATLS